MIDGEYEWARTLVKIDPGEMVEWEPSDLLTAQRVLSEYRGLVLDAQRRVQAEIDNRAAAAREAYDAAVAALGQTNRPPTQMIGA